MNIIRMTVTAGMLFVGAFASAPTVAIEAADTAPHMPAEIKELRSKLDNMLPAV